MSTIKTELEVRAKFKAQDVVYWHGIRYTVWNRYWRRAEDAFYYDLREVVRGKTPDMPRKVPEGELAADR